MKKYTNVFALAIVVLSSVCDVQAAIYTASTSGNFSSTATWQGGVVPPTPLSANDIIISSGVTVTLDQNLVLNSTFSLLQVYGTGKIISTSSHYVALNAGNATGDVQSVIDVDSVHIGSATLQFYGNIIANKIVFNNANIPAGTTVTAESILRFTGSGTININSGSTLVLGTGTPSPTIILDGAALNISSGAIFNLSTPYNVRYEGNAGTIGLGFEWAGSGLTDVEIAVPIVTIMAANLTINGALKLSSGNLSIDNFTLSLAGNCAVTGNGNITGGPNSSLNITSSVTNLGTLNFSSGNRTLKNFTMNTTTAASIINLATPLEIAGLLSLQTGSININGNTLSINPASGSITGGSANSYIITGVGGMLKQNIANSANTTFQIGNTSAYAPVTITNMGSTSITDMGLNVVQGVKANGATGPDLASLEPIVNATWTTTIPGSTPFTYAIEPMWSASMEVNGFDRNKYHVSQYIGGSTLWSKSASAVATTSGSMYAGKKENVTTVGYFAVFDENTLGINNIVNGNTISIHPNPATSNLQIAINGTAEATIYNISGQVLNTFALSNKNNIINIASLSPGLYYIRLSGEGVNGTGKFVKQ